MVFGFVEIGKPVNLVVVFDENVIVRRIPCNADELKVGIVDQYDVFRRRVGADVNKTMLDIVGGSDVFSNKSA